MKILKEFAIIFFCLMLGSITKSVIQFPIPETVYGMLYLFVALMVGAVKIRDVNLVSFNLLDNLSFFLIPPSVAFMNVYPVIKDDLLKFFALIFISASITMSLTALVVKLLQGVMKSDK